MTKYGAIYAADGRVLAATPTFHGSPPELSALQRRDRGGFDLWFDGEHLRGILTAVPKHPGYRLLLAAPRADLDGDAAFLFHAMAIVFVIAVGWVVVVAMWLVGRLTREHGAIMAVARRVAAQRRGVKREHPPPRAVREASARCTAHISCHCPGPRGHLERENRSAPTKK